MLDVNIEKIVPVTEARDNFNKIVDEVEASDELYVLTKNGKPAAILVGVHHLEKLTGISHKRLIDDDAASEEPAVEAAPVEAVSFESPVETPAETPVEAPVEPQTSEPVAPEVPVSDAFSAFASPATSQLGDAVAADTTSFGDTATTPTEGINPAITPGPMPLSSEPEEKPLTTPDWFTQPAMTTEPAPEIATDVPANSSPMSDPPLDAVPEAPSTPAPSSFGNFENPVPDNNSIPAVPIINDTTSPVAPTDAFATPDIPDASNPIPPMDNSSQQAASPFPSDDTAQQSPPPQTGSF